MHENGTETILNIISEKHLQVRKTSVYTCVLGFQSSARLLHKGGDRAKIDTNHGVIYHFEQHNNLSVGEQKSLVGVSQ